MPRQYTDFTSWQRDWLGSEEQTKKTSYRRESLTAKTTSFEMPRDYSRPSKQSFRGAELDLAFPRELDNCCVLSEDEVLIADLEFSRGDNGWLRHRDNLEISVVSGASGDHGGLVLGPYVRSLARRLGARRKEFGLTSCES